MLVTCQNKSFRKFVIWPVGTVSAVKTQQPEYALKAKIDALLLFASRFDKLLINATHNRLR